MRLSVILLSLLAAIFFVAGCGSGGSSAASGSTAANSSTEEAKKGEAEASSESKEAEQGKEGKGGKEGEGKPSSEKAALIKEGDEICSKVPQNYATKLKALEKKNGGKKPSAKETTLKAAVPPLYTAIEEFEKLTAPSGEEEALAAIIAALEAAAKGLEAKPESKLSGPKSPFAEFQKLTGEYGFKVCPQL